MISATVYAQHPDLALSHTIQSLSAADGETEVVSDAGTDPEHDVYYFWIEAPDFDAVEETLVEDHTVANFSVITGAENKRTYRIEYSDEAKLITPTVTDIGGITRESRSYSNGWKLHLQFRNHDGLSALYEYASEEDIRLELIELRQQEENDASVDFGLTESQQEALMAAFMQGYYDEPREASLEELASFLGISQTAVSGRLKRGSARLIEKILINDSD
jgi:predicted DNA binding protein